jgi:pimeloyl-ACP methyl ester carboxylesterase
MEKITSADGTQLAFYRRGRGSPLVIVHGTGAANPTAWTGVLPVLEEQFTLYAMDRRGRGESGDSSTYTLERELEDIVALIDSIGEPVDLMGHSFGGLCALESALLTPKIRKLILYEPAITLPGAAIYPEWVISRFQALMDEDDREGVLTLLYREVVKMSPAEFDQMRSSPAWPVRLAAAHTVVREAQAESRYHFNAERFKHLRTPTLLLLGSESPSNFKRATEAIHVALPNSRIAVMQGQQHIAMYVAPELLVDAILRFLH